MPESKRKKPRRNKKINLNKWIKPFLKIVSLLAMKSK